MHSPMHECRLTTNAIIHLLYVAFAIPSQVLRAPGYRKDTLCVSLPFRRLLGEVVDHRVVVRGPVWGVRSWGRSLLAAVAAPSAAAPGGQPGERSR